MFWDKTTETLKGEKLKALQIKRLKQTIRQSQNVGFYKKRLADVHVHPEDIRTLDDIDKIPFTKKQDLRDGYPFGFLAVPLKKVIRIHTTSGTTGKPTVVGYTKKDLDTWAELIARNMTMVGVTENDIFQNMVNYGMFTGGLGFHYGAEKIGMTVVPGATGNTKRQIEMIKDFGVTTIHCTPSYAMHLSEVAEDMHASLDSLKTGIFGAEPWSERCAGPLKTVLNSRHMTRTVSLSSSDRELHSNAPNVMGCISGMMYTLLR
jgi:phenylacetate-CoA ligase